jgi:hypothetical protein
LFCYRADPFFDLWFTHARLRRQHTLFMQGNQQIMKIDFVRGPAFAKVKAAIVGLP